MRILIYGINFAPELTGIGKYTGEMAAWLAARGHQVEVIAAPPYYPHWKVQDGYQATRYRREQWHGVTVYRSPVWVPSRPGGARRLLHLASFALASLPLLAWRAARRPDLILVIEPPLMCAPAAWLAARLFRARAWLHVQDYEVDAAFELGLLKGHLLRRVVLRCERWLLRRFDRVSTISSRMMALARAKGVPDDRLIYLPNWIDVQAIRPKAGHGDYRRELGIPQRAVVALYSGNMGGKQGLDTLAEVAALLRDDPRIWFLFCGQGPQRPQLEARCARLSQVRFLDLQPAHRLGELLGTADIHLLPQRASAADLVMPSKLTGMLASGRPVVCGAPAGSELATVVSQCGVVVPAEDAGAMAQALLALAADHDERTRLGAAARAFALTHLHTETVLARAERDFLECVRAGAPAHRPATPL